MKSRDPDSEPNTELVQRQFLGDRLREAREYLGFSQEEVAAHLGIARSALSNIENGQRKIDTLEMKRLAALYKRQVSYFTGEVGEAEPSFSAEVEFLARKASTLSAEDRKELTRFADFLGARKRKDK